MHIKNLDRKSKRESPKRTIRATSGLELLKMVLESDTWRCASKDVGPSREVDCEIPHRFERGTKYSV